MCFIIPTFFFLKKRRGYCYRLRPFIRLSVYPLCYLPLNYWTKFNQIRCVNYITHMNGAYIGIFCPAPWGPGEESKGQISFNFNYKVNFKNFIPNFVCVLTNGRYKTYPARFFILSPISCPMGGTFRRWGCPGGQLFFRHGHVA